MTAPREGTSAELTHADVAAILDLIGRSDVDYLEVEVGGTRIVADRSGAAMAARAAAAPVPQPAAAPAVAPSPAAAPAAAAVHPSVELGVGVAEDLLVVPAPMVGVFYRSPEPGAPPFVEVGSRVEEGATMGLVEVMKMFNSVTAPVGGEVVEVLAGSEAFVEFGQPLFRLRPA